MTAVFLGAAYWSAVALELGGAGARTWADARIAVPTVFLFTVLTLVATLLHLDLFHFGAQHSPVTRAVTWAWLAIYTVVPVLMVVITVRQGTRVPGSRTERLPTWIKAALVILVLLFGGVGLALFLAPQVSASWWPWPLTPLTSRAVGAWLISLGVAAGHALVEDDVARIRPLGATAVAFAVLEGIALLRYGAELDWSSIGAIAFVAALVLLLVLGLWALRAGREVSSARQR